MSRPARAIRFGLIALGLMSVAQANSPIQWVETSFIKLQLPSHWGCQLSAAEWFCTDQRPTAQNTAIIVMSAKEASPEDHIENFQKFLSEPRIRVEKDGTAHKSQVLQIKRREIQGQQWVEAVHLGSEAANYYSRYLATRKNDVAVLVNFTVHKKAASTYGAEFLNAISSMTLKDVPVPNDLPGPGEELVAPAASTGFSLSSGDSSSLLIVAVTLTFIIAAAGFYILRKRN